MHGLRVRWRSIFRREAVERELDEELRYHVERKTEENIAKGMSAEAARRAARIELGGIEQVKEQVRAVRAGAWLGTVVQDARFGLRMLRKNPGFTAVAVLTLALGIGANTAVFSLINAVILRALPVVRPQEMILFSDYPGEGSSSGGHSGHWTEFSSENYTFFRDHDGSFKELCAFETDRDKLKVREPGASGQPDTATGELVSGNFFSFFGLTAAAGRMFSAEDDRPGATPVTVLDYTYWTRKYHNDDAVIGQVIQVNDTAFTIVGVAPREFAGVGYGRANMWFPLLFQPQITLRESYAENPQQYWLNIMGRLKPGITLRRAQAAVDVQLKQILAAEKNPGMNQRMKDSYIQLAPGAGGISYLRTKYSDALRILMAIVVIVLLIACANIANLLLSRSSSREKEISIRLAIGSSRGRLIRQLLTESMLLAVLGGALGILIASWSAKFLAALVTGSDSAVKLSIDSRVLMFTAGISILTGILFGLVPALLASRMDLATPIKGSTHLRHGFGLANGLVVFQIAACLMLLADAGLLLRTLRNLADQKLGFDEDHILVAQIDPEMAGYEPAQTPALYQALIDRIEALPGVVSATVASSEPLSGSSSSGNFSIEGLPYTLDRDMDVHRELVGPHYFQTEGIPILLGRDIGPQDGPDTSLVTVINETMARTFFAGMNPIGRRIAFGAPFDEKQAMTIVGVAADARYYSLRDPIPPMEFRAAFQRPGQPPRRWKYARAVEVRVSGNPRAIATEIPAAIAQVATNLPVTRVTVLKQEVSDSIRQNRSAAELSTAFGVLALLLACIGLYGMLSYRVSRRTQEIGIRMALGARQSNVLWLVTKECLVLVAAGLAIGAPMALASTRVIASLLFGVGATDPWTFSAVTVVIVIAGLVACWIPARRAMRVDPMEALRYE
ncbi:MAG: ABC transporter permease [Candidatus Acidiferrales bacterium]